MLSRSVAAFIQTCRRVEIAAFFAAVGSADGRDGNVSDTVVRRQRLCRRNAHRNDPDPCRAVIRVCGAVPAADHPNAAADATKPFTAHGDRDSFDDAYVSAGRADRQRQSFERTDHGTPRDPHRPGNRLPAFTGPVYEAVRKRRSVWGAPAIGHALCVRKRAGRLRLRAVAGADRKSAGNRAGMSFTV